MGAEYKLVVGSTKTLSEKVKGCLSAGFVCLGDPFRTGNRIFVSGDSAYPNSCEYTAEIAQAMIAYYGIKKDKE